MTAWASFRKLPFSVLGMAWAITASKRSFVRLRVGIG
jgi:hypothetical protein